MQIEFKIKISHLTLNTTQKPSVFNLSFVIVSFHYYYVSFVDSTTDVVPIKSIVCKYKYDKYNLHSCRIVYSCASMSWIRDSNLTWCQRVAVNVVRSGPIPRHVAFIMDGNRRFANKVNLNSVTDGHVRGFDKLAEALQWCLDLGIDEVTVYAFSIENFKRQQNEVDTLMEMAREKFERLMEEKDRLNERGICIRMVGNWSLLPLDLQKCMANAMLLTKDNSRAILNVAFSYTSRDEMTDSVAAIVDGVQRNELRPGDISDNLIRRCMYTGQSSDPDLLVRTSGESRLSDFLLWQVSVRACVETEAGALRVQSDLASPNTLQFLNG